MWKMRTVACHRDDAERVKAISFKRMAARMYEITCKEHRDVDSVTEEFAKVMTKDNGHTKMLLASIKGAIVARAQAQFIKVRCVEPATVKAYFQ
jgi:hypothetical protein